MSILARCLSDISGEMSTKVRRTAVYGLIAAEQKSVEKIEELLRDFSQPEPSADLEDEPSMALRVQRVARPLRTSTGSMDNNLGTGAKGCETVEDANGDPATAAARRAQEGFDFELAHTATDDRMELLYCCCFALRTCAPWRALGSM